MRKPGSPHGNQEILKTQGMGTDYYGCLFYGQDSIGSWQQSAC